MEKIQITNDIVSDGAFLNVPLYITTDLETNLNQERILQEIYTNSIKRGSIPQIIDNEKVVFSPVYEKEGEYNEIREIEYNFHFRERSNNENEKWSVIEDGGWNGIGIGDDLDLYFARKSDLLSYLNFTLDDVRYQANKIKKSFIRISFFDSDDPLTQQLLGYNTIFLDSGELYGKCSKNGIKDINQDGITFMGDNSKRLDTRLTVRDKYNTDKSSEGFYIYLFPSEVGDKGEADIYIKVEFNHAGYGRTLMFMRPYPGPTVEALSMTDNRQEIYEYTYLKIRIKYLEKEKRYVYFIPEDNVDLGMYVDVDKKAIMFNLFEANIV